MLDPTPFSSVADIKEFLRPVFFGLEEEDLDELAQASAVRTYRPGEVICQEGTPGSTMYVTVSGRVDIVKELAPGVERHLQSLGPGEIFGEIAILQQGARTATVRAADSVTALEIGQEAFLTVLGRSPSLGIRILVRLTNRLRDSDQQAIAALRKANEELNQALGKLERLDRTKADFIQVSAHELRTPVTALLGYAQMLQANPTMQSHADLQLLVDGIVTSTKRLARVFDMILDASRVVADSLQVTRLPVSVAAIFQAIADDNREALSQRHLTLVMQGLRELPVCYGVPDLLRKAFNHLVNNALKFTPDGGTISVSGGEVLVPDLGPCIQIVVADTGIGIPPEDLELIFEKFYRTGEVALHSSSTTAFKGGGPGLGLTIARGVIQAHGGRIWAESPGRDEIACPGSRFVIQLPLGAARP